MNWPYELADRLALHARRPRHPRNGFISFISGVSMLGIALGVAALIIVLSVMNGFQKEVRDRMLSRGLARRGLRRRRRRAARLAPSPRRASAIRR
jgi:ABC-type lipoprotein release transport system permease subunit